MNLEVIKVEKRGSRPFLDQIKENRILNPVDMRKHLGINIPRRVGADEEPMGFGFPSDRQHCPKG